MLKEAMGLSPAERAELVEQLFASFDSPARKEIDAAWVQEAEERIDAFEQGAIKATPAKKVFDKVDRQPSS